MSGASLVPANVFDQPVFELFFSTKAQDGIFWSYSSDPTAFDAEPERTLGGQYPAVAYDPTTDTYTLCRTLGGGIRCAESVDGTVWTEAHQVVANDASVHAMRPIGLVAEDAELTLFLWAEHQGSVGVYRAPHDHGQSFVIEYPSVISEVEPYSAAASVRSTSGIDVLVLSDGLLVRHPDVDWTGRGGAAFGAQWLAAASFYGEAVVVGGRP